MTAIGFWVALCACACATVAGCAGSGAGLDSNGRPIGSEGGGGALTADFASIQDNVLTPICSVCHAGGSAPQGLRLDAANSYAMIVGVPSVEDPSVLRIKPGDPDNSYLVQKIEGVAAVGAQMPFGGPPLPAATIATIRQWVTNGAPQSAAPPPTVAFAVATVVPQMNEVVLQTPAQIVVAFTRELDRAHLGPASLRLEHLPPGRADEPEDVPVDISVPEGNPFAVLLRPRVPLANGVYRVTVLGGAAPGVAALDGERLAEGVRDVLVSVFAVEATP